MVRCFASAVSTEGKCSDSARVKPSSFWGQIQNGHKFPGLQNLSQLDSKVSCTCLNATDNRNEFAVDTSGCGELQHDEMNIVSSSSLEGRTSAFDASSSKNPLRFVIIKR